MLPGLFKAGNPQVRGCESGQAGFGLSAQSGRALVADLPTGAGGRPGKRTDGGWVVVSFHLHQHLGLLVVDLVQPVGIGPQACRHVPLDHRRVIAVGTDHAFGGRGMGVTNHPEQGFALRLAIDRPVRIKNFVAAML